jgi:hypothetical protein
MWRSVAAVVVGYLIRSILIGTTEDALDVSATLTSGGIMLLGGSFIYSMVAGYVAALIAPHSEMRHGLVLSSMVFISGIAGFLFFSVAGEALWFRPSLTFLSILGVLGGSYLGAYQKKRLDQQFNLDWQSKLNPFLLGSLAFTAFGLIFIPVGVYLAGTTSLTCRRVESTQVDCTLVSMRWLGQVKGDEAILSQVQEAHLELYDCVTKDANDRTRRQQCERLVIATDRGNVYPDLPISSQPDINNFINSNEKVLVVKTHYWGWASLIVFLGCMGLFCGVFLGRLFQREGSGYKYKRSFRSA